MMCCNGFHDVGLLISTEIIKKVIKKMVEEDKFEYGDFELYDYIDSLTGSCNLNYLTGFSGTAEKLFTDGEIYFNDDTVVYISNRFAPSLFEARYSSRDELINEFKNSEIGKYLPDDFDYVDNVVEIYGTYYG